MNSDRQDKVMARMDARYLRERIARLQRELADWPMTEARKAEKRSELHDLRVELLGSVRV